MRAYSSSVVLRLSVVNYAGPQVLDQSERKKIGPKHFVMLTVSSDELARVGDGKRRVELTRLSLLPQFLRSEAEEISNLVRRRSVLLYAPSARVARKLTAFPCRPTQTSLFPSDS
jgi:hypothetical protein